jgi:uncharacterized protein YegJ (DUF2314 family)
MLLEYKLPLTDVNPNHMVKVTLCDETHNESFWVWIESVESDNVIGIISNNLLTDKLEIGQKISFHKNCIKEISNRSYTKEQTETSILISKARNNPITKYFESLNVKFFRGININ